MQMVSGSGDPRNMTQWLRKYEITGVISSLNSRFTQDHLRPGTLLAIPSRPLLADCEYG